MGRGTLLISQLLSFLGLGFYLEKKLKCYDPTAVLAINGTCVAKVQLQKSTISDLILNKSAGVLHRTSTDGILVSLMTSD